MITITKLFKKYGGTVALNSVSFKVEKGEHIAILGANGAGKTTLIEIILGVTKKDSGKVSFNFKYKNSPLEKIGVQFQDATYPKNLTTKEIIDFFLNVAIVKIKRKKLWRMIDIFEMNDFINRDASELSGGQRQKLNVFLALVNDPDVILLDELTTGLDIKVSQSITKFIKSFLYQNEQVKTMILVSHNPYEIETLCNRIMVMEKGNIVLDLPKTVVTKKYGSVQSLMKKVIT